MPRATEIFGPTFRAEGPVRVDDVRQDPRYGKNAPYRGMPEGHLPVASYLAVPVVSRSGEAIGGLFFGHPETGVFGEREERLVVGLAAQAAIAIDNARLFESVRRSEERFGSLVRNASDVVSVLDPDGTIRYQSPAVERLLGHRPEDMVGRNAFDYVHPEDIGTVAGAFAEALAEEEQARVEYRFRHADGSWRYLESAATDLLADPSVRGVVINSRDITERKRAEEELKQSEERYRAVVEQTAECLFLFDAESKRLLETNSAFRGLFGYTTDELKEMRIYDIVEDDPANVDANVRRNLERGHYDVGERRYRCKDGSVVDVEVSGNVISYGNRGEVVLGIARDITERKRAEERMREVREQERRRIARDLHDEVLSDLVYALQDVQIRQAFSPDEGKSLEGTAEALRRSVEGLRAAIFEMRLQESLEQSFFSSLRSLVELNRRMSRGAIEVALEMGEGFPSALPERKGRELVRVLQEAMNNARRHSGARRIKVALGREGDRFWAEVSDDGRGFDAVALQGGVGSSSMRQRTARLGGKLEVHSAPGRGTKVRFSVPVDRMLDTLDDARARSEGS
ncbi:MAG: PAS domain S-box protein [Actinomycetota bacterium]|nr:PAS domain S-box protein [Actinomycetota bacterium]